MLKKQRREQIFDKQQRCTSAKTRQEFNKENERNGSLFLEEEGALSSAKRCLKNKYYSDMGTYFEIGVSSPDQVDDDNEGEIDEDVVDGVEAVNFTSNGGYWRPSSSFSIGVGDVDGDIE